MVATLPVTGPLQRQGSLTATALLSRPVTPDGWACSFGHVWLKLETDRIVAGLLGADRRFGGDVVSVGNPVFWATRSSCCIFAEVLGDLVLGKDRFPSEQRLTIGEDGSNPQAAFGSR